MQSCFQISATLVRPSSRTSTTPISKPHETSLPPVTLGKIALDVPIILAPMAGVTNPPFRNLCAKHGANLTISEMLHASLYLSNRAKPHFNSHETRSVQLYGTDADTLSAAAMRLVEEERVQHIDLNFGCPAGKILRRGGGAAIPGDIRRFERIVKGVVDAAGEVAVTCKLRAGYMGRETFLEAGRAAEACGVAGVTLHARTAEELYDRGLGRAGWWRIGVLVQELGIPVFGNGDLFRGVDAVDMVTQTGCAGVVVGRGCLGRPWLFDDIIQAFCGVSQVTVPGVDVVLIAMHALVEEIVAYQTGLGVPERGAVMAARKWYGWFLQGYGCEDMVDALVMAHGLDQVREIVSSFTGLACVDVEEVVKERGKLGRE